ncbi:hypothetical protein PR048_029626 [Dryococelus australis]|uniref:Retrovirus-related Pol polyprotein from transposon TNT 1-94-like beta-barrel domain-containing protein n=1 Tax=Dryococelus australis TaxID=614101 RepID=A0ABQ9GE80_9NEOP|nr:hypothetical protein PR048_029626 [Dryococelus australis]
MKSRGNSVLAHLCLTSKRESENSVRIIKLVNENNWSVRKFQLVVILKSRDLYGVVLGGEVKQCKTDNISDADNAQGVIVKRLEECQKTHLLTCDSANEMWVKLLSIYEQQSQMSLHQLQQKFFNTRYEGKGIAIFISKLQELAVRLKQHGEKISEQMLMKKIIMSLPDKYKHCVSMGLTELTSRLLIKERIGDKSSVEGALMSRCVRPNSLNCHSCGKLDQFKANCFQNKDREERDKGTLMCFYCKKSCHFIKDCRLRIAKYGKRYSSGTRCLNSEDWYVNSGASKHMCSQRNLFSQPKCLEELRNIVIGNGSRLVAEGIGTVKVEAFNDDFWASSQLQDVLFVPDIVQSVFCRCCSEKVL